ncbi:unnamed protein product [Mucor hiemalis]
MKRYLVTLRSLYRECMQRELDDLARKDFVVEIENGRQVEKRVEQQPQQQPEERQQSPQEQQSSQEQQSPQEPQQPQEPRSRFPEQPAPLQQQQERVTRKRVASVEYDVTTSTKRAKKKDAEEKKLKVLRKVMEEGSKKRFWKYEVEFNGKKLEQQLLLGAKNVEIVEGEDEDTRRLRWLIAHFASYERGERR